ncbi:MAG TPA: hypothetical protein VF543_15415 [Pyrinomonadaceae bacterium]|jgi:hypothetical protein
MSCQPPLSELKDSYLQRYRQLTLAYRVRNLSGKRLTPELNGPEALQQAVNPENDNQPMAATVE